MSSPVLLRRLNRLGAALLYLLDRFEEILISTLMAAATLLIFVAVVHRYGTGVPFLYPFLHPIHLSWAQELCIYMFVWMAKFGAAYGVRTGIHVGVDVAVNMMEPGPRKKVVLFGLLCGALFTFVVGTMGAKFVIELYPTDQVSPDMELPRWIIFLCVPLGSYLMCFRFLQVAWRFLATGIVPHQGHGIEYEAPHGSSPPQAPQTRAGRAVPEPAR